MSAPGSTILVPIQRRATTNHTTKNLKIVLYFSIKILKISGKVARLFTCSTDVVSMFSKSATLLMDKPLGLWGGEKQRC